MTPGRALEQAAVRLGIRLAAHRPDRQALDELRRGRTTVNPLGYL